MLSTNKPTTGLASTCDYEDVDLPNSPLYEYFDQCTEESAETQLQTNENAEKLHNNVFHYLKTILPSFWPICDIIFDLYMTQRHKIQIRNFSKVLQSANSNGLLTSEDSTQIPTVEPISTSLKEHMVFITKCLLCFFTVLIIVPGFLRYFDIDSCFLETWTRHTIWFLVGVLLSSTLYIGAMFLCHLWLGHLMFKRIGKLGLRMQQLLKIFKSNYRTIQEFESISRGFISCPANAIHRMESNTLNTERELPELRKCLFIWMHDLFLHYRNVTSVLISTIPLPGERLSQYISKIPLEEYGNFFKFDPKCDSEFQEFFEASNGLSLSSLKIMHHLLSVQISEFYKRLILSVCPKMSFSKSYVSELDNMILFLRLLDETDCLSHGISDDAERANMLYRNMDNVVSKTSNVSHSFKNTAMHAFVNDVHDMSFRLRSLLKKTISVEDSLTDKIKDDSILDHEFASALEGILTGIKSELSALNEVHDACLDFVQDTEKKVQPELDIIYPLPAKENPNPIMIDDFDSIIEDEVLEGMGLDHKPEDNTSFDDCLPSTKNLSKKMLLELKETLVVRAEECKKREEKALRQKKLNMGESIANEDSCHDQETMLDKEIDDPSSKDLHQALPVEETNDGLLAFGGSFLPKLDSSAIAKMALQRHQQFQLCDETFECETESSSSDDEDDVK